MSTLYMTVGLPASGKSTWAKDNAEKLNAIIMSSDSLREELYGNQSIQGDNMKLFDELHKRIKVALKEGNNVIFDATNISQKRRIHFINELKDCHKVAVYFNISYMKSIRLDFDRDRSVGKEVIERMFHNLQIPTLNEGFDEVKIIHEISYFETINDKEMLEILLYSKPSYEELFDYDNLRRFRAFDKVFELPQDNPHHTFSVSRHIYHVYEYVFSNCTYTSQEDTLKMLWVAVLHDIGKGYTKTFKNFKGEMKRTASFYGHEFVSAQIAVQILHSLGYDDKFILDVAELCQQHMKLLNASDKTKKKLLNLVGQDMYDKLEFFREADLSAK